MEWGLIVQLIARHELVGLGGAEEVGGVGEGRQGKTAPAPTPTNSTDGGREGATRPLSEGGGVNGGRTTGQRQGRRGSGGEGLRWRGREDGGGGSGGPEGVVAPPSVVLPSVGEFGRSFPLPCGLRHVQTNVGGAVPAITGQTGRRHQWGKDRERGRRRGGSAM